MAFYTSRVDDAGNEIGQRNLPTIPTTTRTRNLGELSDSSSINFDFDFQASNSFDDLSMFDRLSVCEREGGIVPPLDLHSELNFPTEPKYTYKPRKYETAKIVIHPNKDYEEWLNKKRQRQANEAARRKHEEEEKRQKELERKRLAEENYQKWLEKKNSATNANNAAYSRRSTIAAKAATKTQRSSNSVDYGEEKRRKLDEWAQNKRKQEKEQRLREQKAKEKLAKEEEARKQLNKGVHEKWLERNKNAPKPVPLNQGLLTLRGTTSKIFVNPNEWRTD